MFPNKRNLARSRNSSYFAMHFHDIRSIKGAVMLAVNMLQGCKVIPCLFCITEAIFILSEPLASKGAEGARHS